MEKQRGSYKQNRNDQKKAATPDSGKKKSNKERPAWMKKPPKGNLKQVKEWNGSKWYWCSTQTRGKCPGAWRTHKPSECKGPGFRKNKAKSDQAPARKRIKFEETKQPGGENPRIQLQRALRATIDDDESSDGNDPMNV